MLGILLLNSKSAALMESEDTLSITRENSMESNEDKLKAFLGKLMDDGVCPGLAAAICSEDKVLFTYIGGLKQRIPKQILMTESALFDVASLTKVLATTMISSVLCDSGQLKYDTPLQHYLESSGNYRCATIRQLLTHTAGFVAEQRLDAVVGQPDETLDYILGTQPIASPGTKYEYSCFGFIVLGKILERIVGAPLDSIARDLVFAPLGMDHTVFNPLQAGYGENTIVATEFDKTLQKVIVGTVHDENARFLGGVAGNAGVFSSLGDTVRFCQMLLRDGCGQRGNFISHERVREFSTDYTYNLETARGIGFLLGSRGATPASENAGIGNYGHTGFTGTSLWISQSKKMAAILLTNRVHPTRHNTTLLPLREKFHSLAFAFDETSKLERGV